MDKLYRSLVFVFFILLLIALFGWQSVMELRGEEPRRAVITFEMIYNDKYWIPTLNGWDYFNKPPLFNWVQSLFIKGAGSMDEWVIRLPSNISFLLTGGVIYWAAKRYLGSRTAFLSLISFLTFGDFLFSATITSGEMDLFFMFLVIVQIFSIWIGVLERNDKILFLGSFIFAALGTLTKGPPSIAFQALTLYPTLIIFGHWKKLISPYHIIGILIYMLMVGGYFFIYDYEGDAIGYIVRLIKESSQRTALEQPFMAVIYGVLEFPLTIIKLMFPWSIAVVLLLNQKIRQQIINHPFIKLLLIFLLFNLPLYWIKSDHKSRYVYMFLPILGLIISYAIFKASTIQPKSLQTQKKLIIGLMLIAIVVLLTAPFMIPVAIPNLMIKAVCIAVACLAVLLLTRKVPHHRFLLLATFIVLFRIGFNLIFLPLDNFDEDNISTRNSISELCETTNNRSINLLGGEFQYHSKLSLLGSTIFEMNHDSSPEMPFSIPYYIIKHTGHPMQFQLKAKPNQIYIYSAKDNYQMDESIYQELGPEWYDKKWKVGVTK